MADFASLFATLNQKASDHDACTATEKCPKKQKPAIYVMVARADTNDPLNGVDVEVSKPTSKSKKTDGEGLAKFDDAKVGSHVAKFSLSSDLGKQFITPASRAVATTQGKTSTILLLLQALPSLDVLVQRSDGNQGLLGGVVVELTGPEGLKQTTVEGTGVARFPVLKPGRYDIKVTLTKTHLEWAAAPGLQKKVVVVGQANRLTLLVHPKGKVDPTIAIDDPKIVLVRRGYMANAASKAKPHRLPVRLGVSAKFDGTGQLTCNLAANITVFKAATGGAAVAFPIALTASDLNQGLSGQPFTLYVEGANPSGAMNDVQLELTLQGGTGTRGVPVNDKLTCVRLKLDICKWRVDAATDPLLIPEADKIDKGRYVHVQNTDLEHERAKIIIYPAEPAAFTGKLRVKVWDEGKATFGDRLELFDAEAASQTPHPNPLSLPNATIPATGQVLWVQGKSASQAMLDTSIRLGLENVPDDGANLVEGDRVTVTVLKTTLQICQSKTKHDTDPDPMSEEDQIKKGRYLHEQDTGFHHGRALVIVKKVEPAAFVGKMNLTVWDVTAKSKDSPRVELFKAEDEIAKSGQTAKDNPFEFDHDDKFPAKGLKLWVEGKSGSVSAALRDTEVRLGIKDHFAAGGRAAVTVVRFKKLKAVIESTPPNLSRLGNSPVTAHELVITPGAVTADDFDEDFGKNKPLPLVEGSILGTKPIKLTVEIEPDAAKEAVLWSVTRDKSATGDHAKVKAFTGNDDVTVTRDGGDKLKATMLADNVGSFHLRPFIDCNGSKKYDDTDDKKKRIDREPYLLMNLILIRVQGVNNLSVANSAAGSATLLKAGSVPTGMTSGDFAGTGNDAVTMKTTARVVGGGQDGKRGLDMLFTGWVNNEVNCPSSPGPNGWGEDVTHAFQTPPPPPNPLLPVPPPNPVQRARCYWLQAGAEITGPVLDSGYAGQGTGGDSCTGTAGANGSTVTKTDHRSGIGQNWEVSNPDSPGGGILSVHPTDPTALLINFKFNIDFRCDLAFWTNRDKVSGPSDAPAARLYSSVQSNTWNIRLESRFGTAYAETVVTRKTVTFTKDGNATRLASPVDGSGLETRQPDGLNSLQADVPF